MRLTRIAPIIALLLSGCAARLPIPTPPIIQDWTVTATWNYDFTNFVACSAAITKGCITSFNWGYMQGSTPVILKSSAPSVCAGTTQPETCTDTVNAMVGFGTIVPYVIANGIDNGGSNVSSSIVQGTGTSVLLGSPTNMNETFK